MVTVKEAISPSILAAPVVDPVRLGNVFCLFVAARDLSGGQPQI